MYSINDMAQNTPFWHFSLHTNKKSELTDCLYSMRAARSVGIRTSVPCTWGVKQTMRVGWNNWHARADISHGSIGYSLLKRLCTSSYLLNLVSIVSEWRRVTHREDRCVAARAVDVETSAGEVSPHRHVTNLSNHECIKHGCHRLRVLSRMKSSKQRYLQLQNSCTKTKQFFCFYVSQNLTWTYLATLGMNTSMSVLAASIRCKCSGARLTNLRKHTAAAAISHSIGNCLQ